MDDRRARIARGISAVVDHPVTLLLKGIFLLVIGCTEAAHNLRTDLDQKRLHVGHGLILIGLFNMLEALPHFISGLAAGGRYLERRSRNAGAGPPSSAGPSPTGA